MTVIQHPVTDVAAYHEHDHGRIQRLLTVEQIMTPRAAFLCCGHSERVRDAFAGIPKVYDAAPVVEGDRDDPDAEVVGLLWRKDARKASHLDAVSRHMDERPIESALPTSTTMLDYARSASADSIAFVSDGTTIIGLVTLFDLERLPVRLSLFQLILYFEQRLGEVIQHLAPNEETWIEYAPHKSAEITEGIGRSRRRDHQGSPILGIGFTEKLEIARKLFSDTFGTKFKPILLDGVAAFRNDVAHGLPFGRVEDVPKKIDKIDTLLKLLNDPRLPKRI